MLITVTQVCKSEVGHWELLRNEQSQSCPDQTGLPFPVRWTFVLGASDRELGRRRRSSAVLLDVCSDGSYVG